jgi:hypothetical protein
LILLTSLLVFGNACTSLRISSPQIKINKPEFIATIESKINNDTIKVEDLSLSENQVLDLFEYLMKLEIVNE